jgi:hypothetical protein
MHVQGTLAEVASSESLAHKRLKSSVDSVDERGGEHAHDHVAESDCGELFCFADRAYEDDVDLVLKGKHEVA